MVLNEVYSKLLSGTMSCKEAADIIQSPEIKRSINGIIYGEGKSGLSEQSMQFIYMVVCITQFIYNYSGEETGLSDTEYDRLYSIMLANGGSDVVSVPLTSGATNVAYHKYPALRGTLKKTYYLSMDEPRRNPSRKYLDEWISSMESKITSETGNTINLNDEEVYVFPKFDGVSCIFEMDEKNNLVRALTRGYTETNEAQDITHHFPHGLTREHHEFQKQAYGLKTEIMMTQKDLEFYNKTYKTDYKNTRSIVSAILNEDEYDPEKASLLHIVPLRVGTEDGNQELAREVFDIYPYLRCRMKDREAIRKFAYANEYIKLNLSDPNESLRCDGAVLYIINPKIQHILGREHDKNLYEVAYKFTEKSAMTTIEDVTFNVGVFGRIAPVATVKPVKLKGNTIEKISLGSVGRFRDLQLRKGDTVKVLYDIIPYLGFDDDCEHGDGELFELPDTCPECGEGLVFSDSMDLASCENPDCPCRIKGKILNFLNKMNIDNISYGIIDSLYDNGFVKSIKDLYSIEKNKNSIAALDGFGAKSVNIIIDSINSHREVPDYVVLGALGIIGASKLTFSKVLSQITMDDLLDIADNNQVSKLVVLPGIKTITAKKIIDGLRGNKKLIKFLKKELWIQQTKGSQVGSFTVCFTKVRDKDLEKWIENAGGTVVDSLTKDTMFLVVPSMDSQSSKIDKAKKHNVKIVSIKDFKATVEDYLKTE